MYRYLNEKNICGIYNHEIQSILQGYSEDTHKKYITFKIRIYICIYLIMNNI